MKILSLVFAFSVSFTALSQIVWTSSDEPAISDTAFYFECDSTVSDFKHINGNGVTWDYSAIRSYSFNNGRTTKAEDATTGSYANFFLNATHDHFIKEHIHSFYELSGLERTAYGIQFNDVNLGDVLATYDGIKDRSYPWSYQSTEAGSLSNCEIVVYPNSTNPPEEKYPANGVFSYTCDATGTIIIGDSSVSDVLRNVRYDSIRGDFGIFGKATMIRQQYEYYKPGTSFPIFVHSYLKAKGALLSIEYHLVLSQIQPKFIVGINDPVQNSLNVRVYPNPTSHELTLTMEATERIEKIQVFDQDGRDMPVSIENRADDVKLDVRDLEDGIYFLVVTTSKGLRHSEKIIKRMKN